LIGEGAPSGVIGVGQVWQVALAWVDVIAAR
jgi:hypothetical protein